MKAPRRRWKLSVELWADSEEAALDSLKDILTRARVDGAIGSTFGGCDAGGTWSLQDENPEMTHERYIAEIEAYLLNPREFEACLPGKLQPPEAAGPEHSEDSQGRRRLTDEAVEKIQLGMGLKAPNKEAKPREADPLSGIDAREWAREFLRIWSGRWSEVDEGLMISWFSNAIMRGFDEGARRALEESQNSPLGARPPACPQCGSRLVMLRSKTFGVDSEVETRQVACIRACVFGPLSSDEKLAVEAWNNFHLNGGKF